MSPNKAIAMAEAWTTNLGSSSEPADFPFFHMVRGLLDHISRQNKDIVELTESCQQLLRENKRIKDELLRGQEVGSGLDQGHRP